MGPQISRRQRRQQNVRDRAQSTGVLTSTGDSRVTDCLAMADAGSTDQQRLSLNPSRLADSHNSGRPWPSGRSCIEAGAPWGCPYKALSR